MKSRQSHLIRHLKARIRRLERELAEKEARVREADTRTDESKLKYEQMVYGE